MRRLAFSLFVALSVCGVACTRSAAPERAPTASLSRLELLSADADVWAFEISVRGVSLGPAVPEACVFEVGERELPAALDGPTFSAKLPLRHGINRVTAACRMRGGMSLRAPPVHYTVRLTEPFEAAPDEADPAPPPWVPATVVYGVIPPLFGSPPLAAVTEALDGLAELGVTALWLSPIFESPPDDYGYAVTNPFAVRSEYGSDEDLQRLVEEAHARELRVLLDLVPNHTSEQHPYYVQAEQLGSRSHYYLFYDRDETGAVTHYFDWQNLPNLDYDHPEVEAYTVASATHWVRWANIDGYRVDAAWGVRTRDPTFWPRFRSALKREKPQLFLLAEASARDPYYVRRGFDAAYDWTEELGHHAWEGVFSSRRGIARRLHAAVMKSETNLQQVFRFLNSNDSGERFITRHGEPLTRVATAALLTLPGIPCLYAFDEVGAEYLPYGALTPVQRANPALRAFHRRWITLRRSHRALQGPGFELLHVSDADEAYVYARYDEASSELSIVALNFSETPIKLRVPLPAKYQARTWRDAATGRSLPTARGTLELDLTPWDSRLLLPNGG